MKGAILSIISASTVAAQLSIAPEVFGVAAVNIDDPEYTTCSVVADYVGECVTSIGGEDALATADPNDLLSCACCISATPVYPLYSACSSYLSDEGGDSYSSAYEAYSVLYSACGVAAICTEGDVSITGTATTAEETGFSTTSAPTQQTYASACSDLADVFTSCSNKIDDFDELPYKSQALCYCCETDDGTVSWTDSFDQYASTCADWAITGEPETVYSVAKTYASFCERFSDVCESATLTSDASSATLTEDSAESTSGSSNSNTEPVTVTIQPTETSASSDSGNAAGSLRVGGCGAILGAILAMAIAL